MASKDKNPYGFPAVLIDGQERNRRHNAIERFAAEMPELLETLKSEGLPTDQESIERFAAMDDADYQAHVKKLFNEYISRVGFCPTSERKRIAANFNSMLAATAPAVATLHRHMADGYTFMTDEEGRVTIDAETAVKAADKATSTPIDIPALTEYHDQWKRIADAWAQLNEWERQHGMRPTSSDGSLTFVKTLGSLSKSVDIPATWLAFKQNYDDHKEVFFGIFAGQFKKQ